jgi:type II secretory pathway component PulJ
MRKERRSCLSRWTAINQMKRRAAFTLTELLVSIAVLVGLVLLFSRLFVSASTVTTSGNKRMETDGQIRPLFERLAADLAQMSKRSDLDFFGKGTAAPNSIGGPMPGNDQFAFYSAVPGYHVSAPGPISLVAYRINRNTLERMAKGLLWNGASGPDVPVVFLPLTISSTWLSATNSAADSDYELIGPYVFRFEYYYLLKNGSVGAIPWDVASGHLTANGLQDVSAISICVAALDSKSRLLTSDTDLNTLALAMNDFSPAMNPGELLTQWQRALYSATGIPRPALSAVRLYERTFALSPNP